MSHDEITKLYKFMSERFDKIEAALETKADKSDFERVINLLDTMIKSQEIYDHERLAMAHQLGRHDSWITALAAHTRYNLRNNT